jgi:hypothetical protein
VSFDKARDNACAGIRARAEMQRFCHMLLKPGSGDSSHGDAEHAEKMPDLAKEEILPANQANEREENEDEGQPEKSKPLSLRDPDLSGKWMSRQFFGGVTFLSHAAWWTGMSTLRETVSGLTRIPFDCCLIGRLQDV